jgi:hypothetical protein
MNHRTALAFALLLPLVAGCGAGSASVTKGTKKLTLFEPDVASIRLGDSAQATIRVAREGMTDPVFVRFENFPPGVTADNTLTFPTGQDSAICTMHATSGAGLVSNHEVRVIVESQGGMTTRTIMKLSVKAK